MISEITKINTDVGGYEFKDVPIRGNMASVVSNGIATFGWMMDCVSSSNPAYASVILTVKRDRTIRNKHELTRLERQFESCVADIERLERSKVFSAGVVAYGLGVVGTACLAGAVVSYLGGMLVLGTVLAVLGCLGWILPYVCFTAMRTKKTAEVAPVIAQKYDEIDAVWAQARALRA